MKIRKDGLQHAAEEAVELGHALLKLARGDGTKEAVTDEAADLVAFLVLLDAAGVIDPERFAKHSADKLEKFMEKYLKHGKRKH